MDHQIPTIGSSQWRNLVCMVRHFSFVGLNLGTAEIENDYKYDFFPANPFLCFFSCLPLKNL
jgi:hypothetical protein